MARFQYRPASKPWRFETRNGASYGTSEERSAGVLPIHCSAGDLQQLLPGLFGWLIVRGSSRDATSGSRLQPYGAWASKVSVRERNRATRRARRIDAAADGAGGDSSDGGA